MPGPTVAARMCEPTEVLLLDELNVPADWNSPPLTGKRVDVSCNAKKTPTLSRSSIRSKSEAGRLMAALSWGESWPGSTWSSGPSIGSLSPIVYYYSIDTLIHTILSNIWQWMYLWENFFPSVQEYQHFPAMQDIIIATSDWVIIFSTNTYQYNNDGEWESGECLCLIQRELLCICGDDTLKGLNHTALSIIIKVHIKFVHACRNRAGILKMFNQLDLPWTTGYHDISWFPLKEGIHHTDNIYNDLSNIIISLHCVIVIARGQGFMDRVQGRSPRIMFVYVAINPWQLVLYVYNNFF